MSENTNPSATIIDSLKNDINSMNKDLDYLVSLVVFMAAYDFGRRAERGENVTEEAEAFKQSMKDRLLAKGMSE